MPRLFYPLFICLLLCSTSFPALALELHDELVETDLIPKPASKNTNERYFEELITSDKLETVEAMLGSAEPKGSPRGWFSLKIRNLATGGRRTLTPQDYLRYLDHLVLSHGRNGDFEDALKAVFLIDFVIFEYLKDPVYYENAWLERLKTPATKRKTPSQVLAPLEYLEGLYLLFEALHKAGHDDAKAVLHELEMIAPVQRRKEHDRLVFKAKTLLARVWALSGNTQQAIELAQNIDGPQHRYSLMGKHGKMSVWYHVAYALIESKDFAHARKALSREPDVYLQLELSVLLARQLFDAGHNDDAQTTLQQIKTRIKTLEYPEERAYFLQALSDIYEGAGLNTQAVSHLDEALRVYQEIPVRSLSVTLSAHGRSPRYYPKNDILRHLADQNRQDDIASVLKSLENSLLYRETVLFVAREAAKTGRFVLLDKMIKAYEEDIADYKKKIRARLEKGADRYESRDKLEDTIAQHIRDMTSRILQQKAESFAGIALELAAQNKRQASHYLEQADLAYQSWLEHNKYTPSVYAMHHVGILAKLYMTRSLLSGQRALTDDQIRDLVLKIRLFPYTFDGIALLSLLREYEFSESVSTVLNIERHTHTKQDLLKNRRGRVDAYKRPYFKLAKAFIDYKNYKAGYEMLRALIDQSHRYNYDLTDWSVKRHRSRLLFKLGLMAYHAGQTDMALNISSRDMHPFYYGILQEILQNKPYDTLSFEPIALSLISTEKDVIAALPYLILLKEHRVQNAQPEEANACQAVIENLIAALPFAYRKAQAYILIGDSSMRLQDPVNARTAYKKAIDYAENGRDFHKERTVLLDLAQQKLQSLETAKDRGE